ncbi:hypothetical protein GGR54DRAFT_612919 [Hypoxylon sp. NC1633]|nr:hypothetical protein GGR54DRAFT_612919 [Hypoxylon sp. NC1633]
MSKMWLSWPYRTRTVRVEDDDPLLNQNSSYHLYVDKPDDIKPKKTERFLQWAGDRWLFEGMASIISTASLAGIIITLALHADRPLPRWPFSITINALISTLATISRSALLVSVTAALGQRTWARLNKGQHPLSDLETYDGASRGPWGSIILLWSTRASDLASLGAVVIILSLAMDPFIQQITSFEPAPLLMEYSNVSARIIFETGVNQIGMVSPKAFSQAPATFTSLVTQGLYFDGNLSDPFSRNALQLRPTSSGGNVSFEMAETLAVCSECANLTSYLPPPEHQVATQNAANSWRWTLPNDVTTHWTVFGDRSTLVIATNTSFNPIVLNNHGRLVILNLTAIVPGWTIDNTRDPPVGTGHPGAAQECSLYWCVNKYDSSMSGGVLTETLISSFSSGNAEPGVPFFSLKPPGSKASFYKQDGQLYGNYSTGWINGTFLINTVTHQLIQKYLSGLLTGMATSLNYYEQGAAIASNDVPLRFYSMASWDGASPTPKFDMQGIFDAIAQGMTTVVRKADSTANSTAVDAIVRIPGPETAMVVLVRVRWVWIILPVVLQVAAMVFVCTTVASSKRQGLPDWKSSSLATLFFGMRLSSHVQHEGVEKWSDMVTLAKNYWPEVKVKQNSAKQAT